VTGILRRVKRPSCYLMGSMYVVAGVLHFVVPELYVQIVPPTRRHAAWATIALLIAIFPANVYMATHGVVIQGMPGGGDPSALVRWGRLPLQGVLILWAFQYTRPSPGSDHG